MPTCIFVSVGRVLPNLEVQLVCEDVGEGSASLSNMYTSFMGVVGHYDHGRGGRDVGPRADCSQGVFALHCWHSVWVTHARVGLLGGFKCDGDGDLPQWVGGSRHCGQRHRGVPHDH